MQKDPAEMTEDEIRMAKEFEKKEAAFLEEREKLKKVMCLLPIPLPRKQCPEQSLQCRLWKLNSRNCRAP